MTDNNHWSPAEEDDDSQSSSATADELENWKRLLVYTHVHKAKASGLATEIAKELRARAKHYTKLQHALVEAIRFKSSTPLFSTFGSKTDEVLADVKPLDRYNQAVDNWWDGIKGEFAEDDE